MKNLIFFLLLFCASNLVAQSKLLMFGSVTNDDVDRREGGVTIQVSVAGSQVTSAQTTNSGSFKVYLEYGKNYKIEFIKEGLAARHLYVNLEGINEEDLIAGEVSQEIDLRMYKIIEGLDMKFFEKDPITTFILNLKKMTTQMDTKQANAMRAKIDAMIAERNKLFAQDEINNKKYEEALAIGDQSLAANKFDEAIKKYEEAQKLKPSETLPKTKIQDANKKKEAFEAQKNAAEKDAKYNAIIQLADKAFVDKNYAVALTKYEEALGVKPNDKHASDRIVAIEDIRKAQQKEELAAKQKEEEYLNLIKAADNLRDQKQYAKAIDTYNQALTKKAEQYPKDQIKAIEKLQADELAAGKLEKDYSDAITAGQSLMDAKKYTEAKAKFQQAATLKPAEKLPKDKIGELDKLIADEADEKKKDQTYLAAIAKANQLLASEKWIEAKKEFEAAQVIKPNETEPKDKIKLIDNKLLELEAQKKINEEYTAKISEADKLFAASKFDEAKKFYQEALGLKANETHPKTQLEIINKKQADQAKALEDQKKYDQFIADATALFNSEKYKEAKQKFQSALDVKPNEALPKEKITAIDKLLGDQAKAEELEQNYQKALSDGASALSSGDLSAAKTAYEKAKSLKPTEKVPQDKLTEIAGLLAEQQKNQAKEAEYLQFVKDGDAKLNAGNLEAAKASYEAALKVKTDSYPTNQLALIETKIAENKAKEAKKKEFDAKITEADQLFASGKLEDAKLKYQDALTIDNTAQHPQNRIKAINDKLAENQSQAEKEAKYNQFIADATALFNSEKYKEAKQKFQSALDVKPNEALPKEKITAIDKLLGDQAKAEELEQNYQKALSDGASALSSGDLSAAKTAYEKAKSLKPTEKVPQDKLTEIAGLLAEQQKNQAKEAEYLQFVKDGDAKLNAGNLEAAKASYEAALKVKTDSYPTNQLALIETKIAENKAKEAKKKEFDAKIAEADQLFASGRLEDAKLKYQDALTIDNTAQHPQNRIKVINDKLAESQSQAEKEAKYNQFIADATALFNSGKYKEAKQKFQSALDVKPNEALPKEKITAIDKLLGDQAKAEELEQNYQKALSDGASALSSGDLSAAKTAYEKAKSLKPTEKVPQDKLTEIAGLLAEQQKNQAKEAEYLQLVKDGDAKLNAGNLEAAKASYEAALKVKTDSYPTNQLALIETKIAENKAKEAKKKEFDAKITEADQLFASGKLEDAKLKYQDALTIDNTAQHPQNRIKAINDKLAESQSQAEKEAKFNQLVAEGNTLTASNQLSQAVAKYEEAISFKDDAQIKKKIAELKTQINAQNAAELKEQNYLESIAKAKQFEDGTNLEAALNEYKKASSIKPTEQLPKDKIVALQKLIDAQKANQSIESQFNQLVTAGDQLASKGDLELAKKKYQEALAVKSDTGVQAKITDLDNRIKENQNAQTANAYSKAIEKGEQLRAAKSFDDALINFENALKLKPNDAQAKQLIELVKKEREQYKQEQLANSDLDKKYTDLITRGEKKIALNELTAALADFTEAKSLKPNESLPNQKIVYINNLLDAQKNESEKVAAYQEAMKEGNSFLNQKKYEEAIASYEKALVNKPNDSAAKSKIDEAKQLIAQNNSSEIDTKYTAAMNKGQAELSSDKLDAALEAYKEALALKPGDKVAKSKMDEVNKRITELAKQEQQNASNEQAYQKAKTKADDLFNKSDWKNAQEAYDNLLRLRPGDDYAKKQLEATIAKRKAESEDEQNELVQKIITKADEFFDAEKWDRSLGLYERALTNPKFKGYAQKRIDEINAILANNGKAPTKLENLGERTSNSILEGEALMVKSEIAKENKRLKKIQVAIEKVDDNRENSFWDDQKERLMMTSAIAEKEAEKERVETEQQNSQQETNQVVNDIIQGQSLQYYLDENFKQAELQRQDQKIKQIEIERDNLYQENSRIPNDNEAFIKQQNNEIARKLALTDQEEKQGIYQLVQVLAEEDKAKREIDVELLAITNDIDEKIKAANKEIGNSIREKTLSDYEKVQTIEAKIKQSENDFTEYAVKRDEERQAMATQVKDVLKTTADEQTSRSLQRDAERLSISGDITTIEGKAFADNLGRDEARKETALVVQGIEKSQGDEVGVKILNEYEKIKTIEAKINQSDYNATEYAVKRDEERQAMATQVKDVLKTTADEQTSRSLQRDAERLSISGDITTIEGKAFADNLGRDEARKETALVVQGIEKSQGDEVGVRVLNEYEKIKTIEAKINQSDYDATEYAVKRDEERQAMATQVKDVLKTTADEQTNRSLQRDAERLSISGDITTIEGKAFADNLGRDEARKETALVVQGIEKAQGDEVGVRILNEYEKVKTIEAKINQSEYDATEYAVKRDEERQAMATQVKDVLKTTADEQASRSLQRDEERIALNTGISTIEKQASEDNLGRDEARKETALVVQGIEKSQGDEVGVKILNEYEKIKTIEAKINQSDYDATEYAVKRDEERQAMATQVKEVLKTTADEQTSRSLQRDEERIALNTGISTIEKQASQDNLGRDEARKETALVVQGIEKSQGDELGVKILNEYEKIKTIEAKINQSDYDATEYAVKRDEERQAMATQVKEVLKTTADEQTSRSLQRDEERIALNTGISTIEKQASEDNLGRDEARKETALVVQGIEKNQGDKFTQLAQNQKEGVLLASKYVADAEKDAATVDAKEAIKQATLVENVRLLTKNEEIAIRERDAELTAKINELDAKIKATNKEIGNNNADKAIENYDKVKTIESGIIQSNKDWTSYEEQRIQERREAADNVKEIVKSTQDDLIAKSLNRDEQRIALNVSIENIVEEKELDDLNRDEERKAIVENVKSIEKKQGDQMTARTAERNEELLGLRKNVTDTEKDVYNEAVASNVRQDNMNESIRQVIIKEEALGERMYIPRENELVIKEKEFERTKHISDLEESKELAIQQLINEMNTEMESKRLSDAELLAIVNELDEKIKKANKEITDRLQVKDQATQSKVLSIEARINEANRSVENYAIKRNDDQQAVATHVKNKMLATENDYLTESQKKKDELIQANATLSIIDIKKSQDDFERDGARAENVEKVKELEKKQSLTEADNTKNKKEEIYSTQKELSTIEENASQINQENKDKQTQTAQAISDKTKNLEDNASQSIEDEKKKRQDARKLLDDLETRGIKFNETIANTLGTEFPEGVTEQNFEIKDDDGNIIGMKTRRIVVKQGRGDVYVRSSSKFGITYTKNGLAITEHVWQKDTQDATLVRHKDE
jgi:epidermal growth factor receptor substrate 15